MPGTRDTERLEMPIARFWRWSFTGFRLDDRGELLRDTMPSFGAIDEGRRMAIAKAACRASRP